jgi:hypothetical protein
MGLFDTADANEGGRAPQQKRYLQNLHEALLLRTLRTYGPKFERVVKAIYKHFQQESQNAATGPFAHSRNHNTHLTKKGAALPNAADN